MKCVLFHYLWAEPESEHDHGLLTGILGVLRLNDVHVRVLQLQLVGERDPVLAQQVADVRHPEVRSEKKK